MTIPTNINDIAYYLIEEGIIVKQDNGLYAITNLGAILLAKNINNFPRISRKAVRIVQYSDTSRLNLKREDTSIKGYAVDIDRIINYIKALIPSDEIITDAVRNTYLAYPILAIREIIANALIHQDFSITGTGSTVEIFSNRIEITNPGLPLIDIKRIIDNPPKSRNEKLASLMRRFGLCEELGSGWDRIIVSVQGVGQVKPSSLRSSRAFFFSSSYRERSCGVPVRICLTPSRNIVKKDQSFSLQVIMTDNALSIQR